MTLVEFLLARIAEDEAVARAGIAGQADPENGWGYEGRALTPHVGIIHEAVQAAHILRWHPARVLAECEAKRRIVELHTAGHECSVYDRGEVDNCYYVHEHEMCSTLRLLALPYAEHADSDPAWRP